MYRSVSFEKCVDLSEYRTSAPDSLLPFRCSSVPGRWKPPACLLTLWFCLSQNVTCVVLYRVTLESGRFHSVECTWDHAGRYVSSLSCWAVSHCVDVSLFVHPATRKTFGLVPILVIIDNAAVNNCALDFLWTKVCVSLGWLSTSGSAVSYVTCMFNFEKLPNYLYFMLSFSDDTTHLCDLT